MTLRRRFYYMSLLLVFTSLQIRTYAQPSMVQIRFDEHLFKIKEVNDQHQLASLTDAADIKLFYEHFQVEDYEKYRNYYYQGTCLASAEDYKNWRAFVKGQNLEIVARFILESPKYSLSIIQYRIGKDGTYLYAPFTLQKINNAWYLLNLGQSTELMQVKGFFTHINHTLLAGANTPALWSQQPDFQQFVSAGGIINGSKLFELYPARYEENLALAELSHYVFHGISEMDAPTSEKFLADFRYLAEDYQISSDTRSRMERMVIDGNFSLALETIFHESAADNIIEVSLKLNQILSEQR